MQPDDTEDNECDLVETFTIKDYNAAFYRLYRAMQKGEISFVQYRMSIDYLKAYNGGSWWKELIGQMEARNTNTITYRQRIAVKRHWENEP